MKRRITLFVILFLIACDFYLAAQDTQNITVSGLLDSSLSLRSGAGDAPAFSYGIEEYANIRMQARLRDKAVFYGAVNFITTAGNSALTNAVADVNAGLLAGNENYATVIELERLYFRLNGETVDFDGGLLRLPFGYGQVWGPSDFLNPRNPLFPDARPRAVLGAGLFWYPQDELKIIGFGTAPRNPFSHSGEGGIVGISMDQHWDKASLQTLYCFESPSDGADQGIHRAGISVKADIEAGLVMDALYAYNGEVGAKIGELSFSFGADYSFFDGNLIILAEYLYNGETSSTSIRGGNGGILSNENYLYTGFTWSFNSFTNITAALISCFDDISFTPVISFNHDLFQGATLILTAQIPLDRDLFTGNGNHGELGPYNRSCYCDFNAKIRLRF